MGIDAEWREYNTVHTPRLSPSTPSASTTS